MSRFCPSGTDHVPFQMIGRQRAPNRVRMTPSDQRLHFRYRRAGVLDGFIPVDMPGQDGKRITAGRSTRTVTSPE
jgi:hypothetical protein